MWSLHRWTKSKIRVVVRRMRRFSEIEDSLEAAGRRLLDKSNDTHLIGRFQLERTRAALAIERMRSGELKRFLRHTCFQIASLPVQVDADQTAVDEKLLVRHMAVLESAKVNRKLTLGQTRSLAICCLYKRSFEIPEPLLLRALIDDKPSVQEAMFKYTLNLSTTYIGIGDADRHNQFLKVVFDRLESKYLAADDRSKAQLLDLLAKSYSGSCPISHKGNMTELLLADRRFLRRLFESRVPQLSKMKYETVSRSSGKIRIGLIRYDFGGEIHSFSPILRGLDSSRFDVTLFTFSDSGRESAEKLYPGVNFIILDKNDFAESLAKVRSENLDLLINSSSLSGNFINPLAALLMFRGCHLQLTACADVTSSGIPEIDYLMMGENYIDDNLRTEMIEPILPLKGGGIFVPRPPKVESQRVSVRHELDITADEILFVSNAHVFKLVPELVDSWMQILAQVDNSHLLLMPYSSTAIEDRYERPFSKMLRVAAEKYNVGIDRVKILKVRGPGQTLAKLTAGDIYLDSFPYCGPTSTIESLTLGLPPVIMKGKYYRESLTAGFVAELALQDCVHHSVAEYVKAAVQLANNASLRDSLQKRIRERVSTVTYFNEDAYIQELETLFQRLTRD